MEAGEYTVSGPVEIGRTLREGRPVGGVRARVQANPAERADDERHPSVLSPIAGSDPRYDLRMVFLTYAAVTVVTIWMTVAYFRVEWDQWEVIAEKSTHMWVRRALSRKWLRVPLMVLLEATRVV